MTKQRRALLEELKRTRSHPTAHELHKRLQARMPAMSLSTIYRNLEILVEEGRVRVLEDKIGGRRYDGDLEPHQHARCVHCGRLEDIQVPSFVSFLRSAQRASSMHVIDADVEFQAVCGKCTEAGDAQRS